MSRSPSKKSGGRKFGPKKWRPKVWPVKDELRSPAEHLDRILWTEPVAEVIFRADGAKNGRFMKKRPKSPAAFSLSPSLSRPNPLTQQVPFSAVPPLFLEGDKLQNPALRTALAQCLSTKEGPIVLFGDTCRSWGQADHGQSAAGCGGGGEIKTEKGWKSRDKKGEARVIKRRFHITRGELVITWRKIKKYFG